MTQDGAIGPWLDEQWAQAPDTFTVSADGADIACRGWNLAAHDLPGIILVHGFRAHAHWWDHIAPSLADRFRVIALSRSGMGDSGRREHYSRAQHGREILAVAKACGMKSAILITHSFGTLGGILAANSSPGSIARLIMIDAGLPIEDEPERRIEYRPLRPYPTMEEALDHFGLMSEGPSPDPRVRAYIARHSVRQTAEGWMWKFDPRLALSLNDEEYRQALFGITVPVDIVAGEQTSIMTEMRRAAALRMAPHAGAPILVPASEHHVMIDQPVALVTALRALLANTPPR